jgi:transposase
VQFCNDPEHIEQSKRTVNIKHMSKKHTYFGFTTTQQRKLLFEEWETTGSVTQACQKARVSRGLFYYWKPRFERDGYAGLEEYNSRVAHKLNRKEEAVRQRVITMRQANPDWGKKRIAQEMAKANNWVPVVSANTVKRILSQAGLWPESELGEKKKSANERTHR